MKRPVLIVIAALVACISTTLAEDLPTAVLTKPGKLLLAEDFSKPIPPPEGSTAQFASGFHGWRCNVVPRGGWWNIVDGTFRGMENPEVHHPATASIGFDFK